MTLGPLEYLMVTFEGNQFTGQILAELRSAREKGIIRVVDLFVIKKPAFPTRVRLACSCSSIPGQSA